MKKIHVLNEARKLTFKILCRYMALFIFNIQLMAFMETILIENGNSEKQGNSSLLPYSPTFSVSFLNLFWSEEYGKIIYSCVHIFKPNFHTFTFMDIHNYETYAFLILKHNKIVQNLLLSTHSFSYISFSLLVLWQSI